MKPFENAAIRTIEKYKKFLEKIDQLADNKEVTDKFYEIGFNSIHSCKYCVESIWLLYKERPMYHLHKEVCDYCILNNNEIDGFGCLKTKSYKDLGEWLDNSDEDPELTRAMFVSRLKARIRFHQGILRNIQNKS